MLRRVQAQAGDPAAVAFGDLQPPAARMIEHVARLRNAAGEDEGEAAQRVDILLDQAEPFVDRLGDILQLGAGIGVPDSRGSTSTRRPGRLLVMLVLDVADDLLDDVLDRQNALGAAEFVDDDGEMDAAGAHPREQIEHAHRFGHVERRAHQRLDVGRRRRGPKPGARRYP